MEAYGKSIWCHLLAIIYSQYIFHFFNSRSKRKPPTRFNFRSAALPTVECNPKKTGPSLKVGKIKNKIELKKWSANNQCPKNVRNSDLLDQSCSFAQFVLKNVRFSVINTQYIVCRVYMLTTLHTSVLSYRQIIYCIKLNDCFAKTLCAITAFLQLLRQRNCLYKLKLCQNQTYAELLIVPIATI